jgi:hypothetical protein
MVDPVSGTRVWLFDDDATLVTLPAGPMDKATAQFLTQTVDVHLQPWLLARQKVRFIHDWRSCAAYEPAGRDLLIDWGRRWRTNHREVLLQISDEASPFMRIAVTTGIAALRLAGMHVQLLKDLGPVYATLEAKTPRAI